MAVKLSVVMPVYNSSEYLVESIESTLCQTFSDFEFIIVDDGSTDNSIELIESFKDPRIHLLQSSHNFIQSLNWGMKSAKGKYIVRMDSDDKMLPHRLEFQYNYMESHPNIGICGSWIRTFGTFEDTYVFSDKHEVLICNMLLQNPLCHPSVIIRKDILETILWSKGLETYKEEYKYAEDYKLWCDLVISGVKISNIQEVLLLYRCSKKQVTSIFRLEMTKCTQKIQKEYLVYVMQKIVSNKPKYFNVVNNIIKLNNTNCLSSRHMIQMIKCIYSEFLNR